MSTATKVNRDAWSHEGVKVRVEYGTDSGGYLVRDILDEGDDTPYEGYPECLGPLYLVSHIYDDPPVAVYDKQIAELQKQIEKAQATITEKRNEIYWLDAEIKNKRILVDAANRRLSIQE